MAGRGVMAQTVELIINDGSRYYIAKTKTQCVDDLKRYTVGEWDGGKSQRCDVRSHTHSYRYMQAVRGRGSYNIVLHSERVYRSATCVDEFRIE